MLRCTGEAFGELFLAMTDNLSSKCFAPTNQLTKYKTMLNTPPKGYQVGYFILKGVCHNY
jgi:hypothetical protein